MSIRGRIIAALATLIGVPVVVLLLAVITIAVFGVSIDASRWRDALAARASTAMGRQVTLDGPLELELGRDTGLHVGGVRILNPPGFATPELATLRKVRARIDLLAALSGRLLVHSFEAADGRVYLERAADGRTNWASARTAPAASQLRTGDARAPVEIEIERMSIRDFAFEYRDQRSGAHSLLDLDELAGIGKWSEPLQLTLRGRVGNDFPYTIRIEGASAQLLQQGAGPWPFKLDAELLGTRLHASGTLDAMSGAARFELGAAAGDLEQISRFLQAGLPQLGAAALTGKVRADAGAIELSDLHGSLGASEIAGGLVLTLGGARRRVTGALTISTLDLRPWLDAGPQTRANRLTYDELVRQTLPLRGLVPVDADLVLHVGRWIGSAVEVQDTRIELQADQRGVRAPITGTIAGVPLTGRIDLDTASATPALALELSARRLPLRGLAQRVGAPGFDGHLGSFALALRGRGETLGALIADLELRLTATAARLRYTSPTRPRPFELNLDAVEVVVPRGRPLRATLRGALLGERATLAVRASPLPHLLREPATPLELELVVAGATARVAGTLAWPGTVRSSDLAFRLDAQSASLARLLGLAPESTLPLALRGRVHWHGRQWRLEDTTLKLGRSEMTLDVQRSVSGGKPLLTAALRSPLIDVPELKTLRRAPARTRSPGALLDALSLPQGIELASADIGLGVKRLVLGRNELVDVAFSARIRDGRLAPSPFAARFAGVPFEGRLGLDLRSALPEVSIEMSTSQVDVGGLLRRLGVAEAIDTRVDALQVKLVGRGSDWSELLERSSFEARLRGGVLAVRGPARKALTEIRLEQALVSALPGKPVSVRLQGTLDETPVEVTVASAPLGDFARDVTRVPFSVEAKAAGARLSLAGQVSLPLGRGGELTLQMAGEQLDSLSTLTRTALPPWKPWSIEGPIRVTPTGYEVIELAVQAGQSRLKGRGRLDLAGARPRLDVYLSAPNLQLDDFPFTAQVAAGRRPATAEAVRATVSRTATQTHELLSAAFLQRFDAYVDVTVDHVHSGSDRLGDGMLRARLLNGRLDISPAEVNLPGGSARVSMFYDPTGPEVALAASVHVERFDYGILVRRLRPGTDLAGLFSLSLELTGKAPTLNTIMAHADGHIDLAVWPKNLRGGIIDRWAVNVFFALLPFIDPGRTAHVNCVVGRMDLNDGKLTQDALLIDTSRVRVFGVGGADFFTEEIAFRFRPRAKGMVLFSLQPPIDVTGTMTDFRVGIPRGTTFDTAARFLTSVFVVPMQMLTRGPLPRDGADVCTDPLR